MAKVFTDLRNSELKKVYNYLQDRPLIESVGPARRDILKREFYNYRGVQMVDLVHASRGCRYYCYPCAVAYLGGRKFRPRPLEKSISEMAGIDNNRLFIVDNSLSQDTKWEMALFREMIPLKKKWCSHPIEDKPEVLDLAARAGAWYVYQAVFDMSDLAEFTVLTPFPHTRAYDDLKRQNRIFSFDWNEYSADKVVYTPKHMTPEKLQELLDYAWDTFYGDQPQEIKMFNLFQRVVRKEIADNTYRPRNRRLGKKAFGKAIDSEGP
jgi:hypothetical protein